MSSLVSSLISDPAKLRMVLSISDSAIDLLICPIDSDSILANYSSNGASNDTTLIYRRIELNADNQKALDEAVYDNPLLLEDFGRTDVLIDSRKFMVTPSAVASSSDAANLVIESFWPGEPLVNIPNDIIGTPYAMLSAVDHKLFTFIRRTFANASVTNRIFPFVTFCVEDAKDNDGTEMYVNLRKQSIDIVYISNHNLMKANTFPVFAVSDMVYFIMLMASAHGFDYNCDTIMVCGDSGIRDELVQYIEKYIRNIVQDTCKTAGADTDMPFELGCMCGIYRRQD